MRTALAWIALLACCVSGCANGQVNRPCGPGYLGNIFVPQGFLGADFHDACYGHDACYATPGTDRKACDQQFYDDMVCACECSSHPALCRMRARHWYRQVRLFGALGFHKAQRDACNCAGDSGPVSDVPTVVPYGP